MKTKSNRFRGRWPLILSAAALGMCLIGLNRNNVQPFATPAKFGESELNVPRRTTKPGAFAANLSRSSAPDTTPFGLAPNLGPIVDRLTAFALSGDIREIADLNVEQIRKLADAIAWNPGRDSMLSSIDSVVQGSAALAPGDPELLADYLVGMFRALKGQASGRSPAAPKLQPMVAPIAFSALATETGSIPATQSNFGRTAGQIYGVFENHAWPAGISQVFCVWRSASDSRVQFQELERIFPSAPSNYVWCSPGQDWPPGVCRLDVYDPHNNYRPLASGTFTID